jgi:HK97 family phage major capsid protein
MSLTLRQHMHRKLDQQFDEYEELDRRQRATKNRKDEALISRAIAAMAQPAGLKGTPEHEFFETTAKLSGQHFDSQRIVVPFAMLQQRDLTVATAAAAGYLVATDSHECIDILRPFSVTARMGLVLETGLIGNQVMPKVVTKTTPYWLGTEDTEAQASGPTLAQMGLTPKQVGIVVSFSRALFKQSSVERVVRRELLRTVGTAIDQSVINGPGGALPLGLLNTPGVQSQSGTSLSDGTLTMKKLSAEANANDEQIRFLSTPALRELLEKRSLTSNSSKYVWQNDQVADRRAFVSTDMPTGTMICGDWSNVYVGIWGSGLVVEINPFGSGFKAGIIEARILVSCDCVVLHPSAFVVASSIT